MVKVIVGAVLAIPIAYLLVLWVFNQDPLNLGPQIGNVVPMLVPDRFRKEIEDISDTEGLDPSTNLDNPVVTEDDISDDSPVVPKLDPERVLNSDLDKSN